MDQAGLSDGVPENVKYGARRFGFMSLRYAAACVAFVVTLAPVAAAGGPVEVFEEASGPGVVVGQCVALTERCYLIIVCAPAVSVFGDAGSCTVGVSGTGHVWRTIVATPVTGSGQGFACVTVAGSCEGAVAVSGTGTATEAHDESVCRTDVADVPVRACTAASGTGSAHGHRTVSGCDTTKLACADPV